MYEQQSKSTKCLLEESTLELNEIQNTEIQSEELTRQSKLNLRDDGISITTKFLSDESSNLINQELDVLYSPSHLSLNGYLGHVFNNNTAKTIALPTASVRSINLLELAIDIAEQIQKEDPIDEHRVLTALEIWQEKNQPVPLFWHTDNREGMIRAFIYLEGGEENSGAFKYMKGTHKRRDEIMGSCAEDCKDHSEFYHNKLTDEQITNEKHNIIIANNGPGAMAIAYTEGFHGNLPRINRRRILMYEFQPYSKFDYPRSDIYLPSSLLSEKVRDNINLFVNSPEQSPQFYGTDAFLSKPPSRSKKYISIAISFGFYIIKKSANLIRAFKKQ